MRGLLILIEGLDRSGKSTQCDLLQSHLNSTTQANLYKFPDRSSATATGSLLHSYLTNPTVQLPDEAVHLLFSANRWERQQDILADLTAGKCVILDRYVYSGISFTHAKSLSAAGSSGVIASLDWCAAPDIGLPQPDLTIFLEVDEDTAARRGGYGAERYETKEIQTRVRQVFARFEKLANTDGKLQKWHTVNAAGSIEEVHQTIRGIVEEYLANETLRKSPVDKFESIV
ncbi:thymidylate kinase [Nadsonia fulvescens var. elongata DSM 6958]|uniref:Thymidylate kinase n=1 Tax=Nadsonia fulvescens var. elongata DSM 6958 TaxID=857566 RepID=A0A1E3PJT5_9ASCO|nr:thymidylate kinase [Nadsonia fulvescens var. elongata DSM 6958]